MSKRDNNAAGIVVGKNFGPRSNIWRVWTNGDELYVAPRSVAGDLKTSLHSSGRFRHAATAQSSQVVLEGDRAWFKWQEPEQSAQGLLRKLIEEGHQIAAAAPAPPEGVQHARLCIWLHDEPAALARYLDLAALPARDLYV